MLAIRIMTALYREASIEMNAQERDGLMDKIFSWTNTRKRILEKRILCSASLCRLP